MADAGSVTNAGERRPGTDALAWALAAVIGAALLTGMVLHLVTREAPVRVGYAARGIESIVVIPLTLSALLVARRRPENPIGWLHLTAALLLALNLATEGYAVGVTTGRWDLPAVEYVAWFRNWLWVPFMSLLAVFGVLLFPDGRLPTSRWRPVAVYSGVAAAVAVVAIAVQSGPLENFEAVENPLGIARFTPEQTEPLLSFFLVSIVAAALSLVVRLRRSTGVVRQQVKVMLFAAVVCAVAATVQGLGEGIFGGDVSSSASRFTEVSVVLAMAGIPLAAGIAILRHGLYEIDVVISKTLVFGVLGAFITGLYAAIVAGASAIVGDDRALSLLAAVVVAVAFQPARERVQRLADRLVYGDRVSPYEVLSSFSAQIGTTFETGEQLVQMARLLAEGTGAVRADVRLVVGGEERPGASWPPDAPEVGEPDLVVPVTHHGERLGLLAVTKARNAPLTPQDHKLVVDLAAQAGIALRNVGLTSELLERVEELRASRQRLVSAQDNERRRIERDLHDGAQQQLVALKIKLGLARMQAEDEGATETAAQITALAAEAGEALDTLRDLAHGIYPPLLAAEGLVPALEAHARKTDLPVDVVADDRSRRYPPEVEVATYYCCLEAMQNIAKYAGATEVVVGLRHEDGDLLFEVRDDGRGFDPSAAAHGAGLRNMTDRVDALAGTLTVESAAGSGTTVRGRLPALAPSDQ